MVKKCVIAAFVLLFSFALCGCMVESVDGLYSLPKTQEEFAQLQALIQKEIDSGSEYSAPTSGSRRQSVQLVDINGDGLDEAVVFLKNSSSTPTVCVYKVVDGVYSLATTITGEGSAIGRVECEDLDGDGVLELIVAWRMSADIAAVKAYSLRDWESAVLLSVSCTEFRIGDFGSLDGDSSLGGEVVVLNTGDEGGSVDIYFTDSAGEIASVSAPLSKDMIRAERFRVSNLADGVPAVFVEGSFQDDEMSYFITDVLCFSRGEFRNIILDKDTGNSIAIRTVGSEVYSLDIDGDGGLDVPFTEKVFRQAKVSIDYYVFDWVSFSADGSHVVCASTYHCYSDGWYYVLPSAWREGFTVRREPERTGERTVVLSTVDEDGNVTDLLTIYTLTGENRADRASLQDRFILVSSENTIYAATLHTENGEPMTDEQKNEVLGRFNIIYSEWTNGAI